MTNGEHSNEAETAVYIGLGSNMGDREANLREAITLILDHRREESLRALPPEARQELVVIG